MTKVITTKYWNAVGEDDGIAIFGRSDDKTVAVHLTKVEFAWLIDNYQFVLEEEEEHMRVVSGGPGEPDIKFRSFRDD